MQINSKIIIFSILFGTILTIAGLINYKEENFPDAVTTKYGFPFIWLSHQTSSIAGQVDIWSINWTNLILSFILWWIPILIIIFVWKNLKSGNPDAEK